MKLIMLLQPHDTLILCTFVDIKYKIIMNIVSQITIIYKFDKLHLLPITKGNIIQIIAEFSRNH